MKMEKRIRARLRPLGNWLSSSSSTTSGLPSLGWTTSGGFSFSMAVGGGMSSAWSDFFSRLKNMIAKKGDRVSRGADGDCRSEMQKPWCRKTTVKNHD